MASLSTHQRKKNGGWIDSQLQLNHQVTRIALKTEAPTEIKVIRTYQQRLSLHRFLETLASVPHSVERLAIVGFPVECEYAGKLASCLETTTIKSLQLCRLLPNVLDVLCATPSALSHLEELRLTFHQDVSSAQTQKLFEILSQSPTLEILKICRLDLVEESVVQSLAQLIRRSPWLNDLRLTGCQLSDNTAMILAQAVQDSNRLQKLDLSLNQISNTQVLVTLLQTCSLQSIWLCQNQLRCSSPAVAQILALNNSLERLFLDRNPLQDSFVHELAHALRYGNTKLKRIGLCTPGNEAQVHHYVVLNEAGRGAARLQSHCLPLVLARVHREPALLYSLLQENPSVWIPS
jgi:hypothetical protein